MPIYLWDYDFCSIKNDIDLFFLQTIACGVVAKTYNFGAIEFKDTSMYKAAIISQGLFEETPKTNETL